MEIKKFNDFMSNANVGDMPHKEIALLAIIEGLLDSNAGKRKKRSELCFIIPPWLYDVKDYSVTLHFLEDPIEVQVGDEDLLSTLRKQKMYIRVINKRGIYEVEIPFPNVDTKL